MVLQVNAKARMIRRSSADIISIRRVDNLGLGKIINLNFRQILLLISLGYMLAIEVLLLFLQFLEWVFRL